MNSTGSQPSGEIELSDLIVEGEYRPSLPETDPLILALRPPEGEGWTAAWWKLAQLLSPYTLAAGIITGI